MTTMVDQKSQQGQFAMPPYDARTYAPTFTNPFATPAAPTGLYQNQITQTTSPTIPQPYQQQQQQQAFSRPGSISIPLQQTPASATSNHSSFSAEGTLPQAQQQQQQQQRSFAQPQYAASVSYPHYPQQQRYSVDYTNSQQHYAAQSQAEAARRASYPIKPQFRNTESFNDALDASRGMLAMAGQADITPRNIYGPRNGSMADSYGFPTTHSVHSSISSASGYPYYNHSYSGSVDGSVAGSSMTDYGSESEMANRTLPVPGQMIAGAPFPPEPASMMTQFNSKMSSATQKKHKCKICDKRFTRPSSLQTHMYSHTGEKPFACDFAGCGRHFSVVSNLRRHKKCHRSSTGGGASGDEE